jgi:hypothetical protein
MDSILKRKICEINEKNQIRLFDYNKSLELDKFLKKITDLEYLSHGTQSLCFKNSQNEVIKCCVKKEHSILHSKQNLTKMVKKMIDCGMPITPVNQVLYEDETWIVFTQPYCRPIEDVNLRFCLVILHFIHQMIDNDIRISDIYYKNFGIHRNRVVMFDYGEVDSFSSNSHFLITNLYSLLLLLGNQLNWSSPTPKIAHWNEVLKDSFGQTSFPEPFYRILDGLHKRDHEQVKNWIVHAKAYINTVMETYNVSLSSVRIDVTGQIQIGCPVDIYKYVFDFVRKNKIQTIFDLHPIKTGIGFKLAQDFPDIQVTLGCYSQEESKDLRFIINNGLIYNTTIVCVDPNDLRLNTGEKFDLVLYGTAVNHLKIQDITYLLRLRINGHGFFMLEAPIVTPPVTKTHQSETLRTQLLLSGFHVEHFLKRDETTNYLYTCQV